MHGRGQAYTQILTFCITPRKFGEIAHHVGKKSNNVAMLLQQLQKYNLIGKIKRAFYLTLPCGINYCIKHTMDLLDDEERITRLVAINLLHSEEYGQVIPWIPSEQYFIPPAKVRELEGLVRRLYNLPFRYENLVNFDVDGKSAELVRRAYWASRKAIPNCIREELQTTSADISSACGRKVSTHELFETIVFLSLPLGKRVARCHIRERSG